MRRFADIRARRLIVRLLVAGALSAVPLLHVEEAFAQDMAAAANAYSTGQKAEMSGDHEAAADMYELADSLAPTPEAVRSALRARKNAGQLGPAAVHAETLITRYPDDKRSRDIAEAILAEAKKKLARYAVRCQPSACNVVVDGAAATTTAKVEHVVYLSEGEHSVVASFGKLDTEAQTVAGEVGSDSSLTFDAPPEPPPAEEQPAETSTSVGSGASADAGVNDSGRGLPVALFISGAAVTVGLGAVTVWSGFDTLKARDEYKDSGTKSDWDSGKSREKRTNILIGATAGAAVITGVLGILTDWGSKPNQAATVRHRPVRLESHWVPSGGVMSLNGSF
jgi:hypothetical protein